MLESLYGGGSEQKVENTDDMGIDISDYLIDVNPRTGNEVVDGEIEGQEQSPSPTEAIVPEVETDEDVIDADIVGEGA